MNLLLSRLDEQQRRWYVAVESNRIGPGGGSPCPLVERGRVGNLSRRPFRLGSVSTKNAAVMMVEQWSMVSPDEKWFNRAEYRLRIYVVRVKEQNDTHFLLWILSYP